MSYLIGFHWGWLLAALILGVIMGWLTYQQRRARWMDGLVWLAALLLVVASIIAISTTILGLPGYLLEVAVLMVVAYAVGCPLGWTLRRLAFVAPVSVDDDGMIPKPGYTFPRHAVEVSSPQGVRAETVSGHESGASILPVGITTSSDVKAAAVPMEAIKSVDEADLPTAVTPEPPISSGAAAATSQAGSESITSEPSQAPATDVPVPFDLKPTKPERSGPVAAPSPVIVPPAPVAGLNVAKREDASATTGGTPPPASPSQEETSPQVAIGAPPPQVVGPTVAPTSIEPAPADLAPTSASDQPKPLDPGALPVEAVERPDLPLFRSSRSAAEIVTSSTPSMGGEQRDAVPTTPAGTRPGPIASDTTSRPSTTTGSASATFAVQGGATQGPGTGPGAPTPEKIAALQDEHRHAGSRPDGWITARDNTPDDLKRIKGIGPQNEGRLHGLGIWHFDQIAAWTPDNVKWVGSYLAFHGRIEREKWIDQATFLASGPAVDFSQRVASGKVTTSLDDASLRQTNNTPTTKRGPRKR